MKTKITEEMYPEEEWFKEANKQTLDTLLPFINHVLHDYYHDYGTIVHAITACAIAAANAANHDESGGITGFQAGFVMWDFIRQWSYPTNRCGLKLLDYDKMLYPQYENSFNREIPGGVWEHIQEVAAEKLAEYDDGSPTSDIVVEHWRSIVRGEVPFGYKVVDK